MDVECVGLPFYPGSTFPRVLGLAYPVSCGRAPAQKIEFVIGDATRPLGTGPKVLAQIVNDKTPNWGGGFALAVRKAWPEVQEDFQRWAGKGTGLGSGGPLSL